MVFSEELIYELLSMPKVVMNPNAKPKVQKKSERVTYQVESVDGEKSFEMYTRQNQLDPDAYSCGLVYHPKRGEKVTLVRYNGSNHVHLNPLEDGELIVNRCHIHRATQRYMETGEKAEKFAETTDRYDHLSGAMLCMLGDCNISGLELPPNEPDNPYEPQMSLGL